VQLVVRRVEPSFLDPVRHCRDHAGDDRSPKLPDDYERGEWNGDDLGEQAELGFGLHHGRQLWRTGFGRVIQVLELKCSVTEQQPKAARAPPRCGSSPEPAQREHRAKPHRHRSTNGHPGRQGRRLPCDHCADTTRDKYRVDRSGAPIVRRSEDIIE
jgi:hypothetical protein